MPAPPGGGKAPRPSAAALQVRRPPACTLGTSKDYAGGTPALPGSTRNRVRQCRPCRSAGLRPAVWVIGNIENARVLTWIVVVTDMALSWRSRGYLPHFDDGTRTQLVTYRLGDSLPAAVMLSLRERSSDDERRRVEIEVWLDAGHGSCLLRNAEAAQCVVAGWRKFDGEQYRLHAWCVMPNHVHVLITPVGINRLAAIVHSQKSYTAKVLLGSRSAGLRPASCDARTKAGGRPALLTAPG